MSTPRCQLPRQLIVRTLSARAATGMVVLGPYRFRCALGRSGIRPLKREADGASPRGSFALRQLYYNPTRNRRPVSGLQAVPLGRDDGWCDAPGDRNYNRPVRHPYAGSAERLWRSDGLYDLIVVVGYNDRPRKRGRGSAIFIHVARPGLKPTEGCVALAKNDLQRLLPVLKRDTRIRIGL